MGQLLQNAMPDDEEVMESAEEAQERQRHTVKRSKLPSISSDPIEPKLPKHEEVQQSNEAKKERELIGKALGSVMG